MPQTETHTGVLHKNNIFYKCHSTFLTVFTYFLEPKKEEGRHYLHTQTDFEVEGRALFWRMGILEVVLGGGVRIATHCSILNKLGMLSITYESGQDGLEVNYRQHGEGLLRPGCALLQ